MNASDVSLLARLVAEELLKQASRVNKQCGNETEENETRLSMHLGGGDGTDEYLLAARRFNAQKQDLHYQQEALMYIVVVLLFYSTTLISLMIKYMRQETRDQVDDRMYQDFLTKTQQLSRQQEKADFARRVSLQLYSMAQMGHMGGGGGVSAASRMSVVAEESRLATVEAATQSDDGAVDAHHLRLPPCADRRHKHPRHSTVSMPDRANLAVRSPDL